eukprot:COSAG03_NODE_7234_length_944_cov_1.501438_1_plen_120_part_10
MCRHSVDAVSYGGFAKLHLLIVASSSHHESANLRLENLVRTISQCHKYLRNHLILGGGTYLAASYASYLTSLRLHNLANKTWGMQEIERMATSFDRIQFVVQETVETATDEENLMTGDQV